MWIRKALRDLKKGVDSPMPTQVVSNEEFTPRPQSDAQKQVEHLIGEMAEVRAPARLKYCSLYLTPPKRMERPRTSRTLPMIDPVIEAFTTLVRPLDSAMPAMISSAAFPKVALSNPPSPSPTRAASASVARPIQPATGTMPRAEQTKSAVGLLPGQKRSRMASGTKIRSQSKDGLSFRSLRISRLASANQPVPSSARLTTRFTTGPCIMREQK